MLMLMLVAASALVVNYPGHRLAVVVLGVGTLAMVSGLAVAAFTAATTADPIDEVRRGMQRVQRGDFDVSVPVFDASELGPLQAGFNIMADGLRERERVRDLFGRHVGRDVARLAEEVASRDGAQTRMGGASCEVAVLFVDLVGSTRLAATVDPDELVTNAQRLLRGGRRGRRAIPGVGQQIRGRRRAGDLRRPDPDCTAPLHALARRGNSTRSSTRHEDIRVGIGVSAGKAVAGNVGDPNRYEYTVIGDPVSEAARLTEVANYPAGSRHRGGALSRAEESETAIVVSQTPSFRGRDTSTEIAVPIQ